MKGNIIIAITSLFLTTNIIAADRYWIGAVDNDWNDTGNWSTTSGGTGGASVPGAADRALFNSAGNVNCNLDVTPTIESIDISVGYTANIDLNGNDLTVAGSTTNDFEDGVFDNTSGGSLIVNHSGITYFRGSTFNCAVSVNSARLFLNGSRFNNTCSMTKTGASSDGGTGGNYFASVLTITNNGTGYILTGNTNPDTVIGDLTLSNIDSNTIYFAHNSAGSYVSGNVICNNNATGVNNSLYLCDRSGSSLRIGGNLTVNQTGTSINAYTYVADDGSVTIDGTTTITNSGLGTTSNVYLANGSSGSITCTGLVTVVNSGLSSANCNTYLGNNGDATLGAGLTASNSGSSTTHQVVVANGSNSSVTITGSVNATNTGAGSTARTWFGNAGDVTFNSTLTIANSSTANNSQVYCNYSSTSANIYNQNVVVSNSNSSSDGVFFGSNGGSSTLAASRTISIGGAGFVAGQMYLRNFTQTGATAQTLTLTGDALLYSYDSDFGGNVTFTAPRLNIRGTNIAGTANLTKNGATDDTWNGGNVIEGNATIVNSGSGYIRMANSIEDTFRLDLTMTNSGTRGMYLAYNSDSNYVGGNVTATNSGTGTSTWIYIGDASNSDLHIEGDLDLTISGSSTTCVGRVANSGSVTVDGNLTFTKNVSSTTSDSYLANGTSSALTVNGNVSIIQSGSGTNGRTYFGNNGDITVQGTMTISNSSSAGNSQVYCNNGASSVANYNNNITVESSNASCDGVYFGNSGGSATLASSRTIAVGGGGFIGGNLYFRNFTQVGATAQNLTNTGTGYIYNYDCNWGGDVNFSSGRMYTRGTTFQGATTLSKTGASQDRSYGDNTFGSNLILNNSGSDDFTFGDGAPDSISGNLTMNNSGTSGMVLGYNSTGNYLSGNLSINTSNASGNVVISRDSSSTLYVGGDVAIDNSSSAANPRIYIGNSGDVNIVGKLIASNSPTGNQGSIYIANGEYSTVVVGDSVQLTNSGGSTTKRIYFGNYGDVTCNGVLFMLNSSNATNSEIYCNDRSTSSNAYNGNIVVQSTDASCDGIRFGNNQGSGTLASGLTIAVGAGGFIGGDIYFRNFTQLGSTAQALTVTGRYIYNYESTWGGNVNFVAVRNYTRGSTYQGSATFEKTGASDDNSEGGNRFLSGLTATNSGSGDFGFGSNTPDSITGNLILTNTGTNEMYWGYSSTGNYVSGDLTATNSGTGTNINLCRNTSTSAFVGGNATLTNSTAAASSNIYFPNNGTMTVAGNLTASNAATGTTGYIYIASGTTSSIDISGTATLTNSQAGTTKRMYLGNNGDVTVGNTLTITNSSTATNSQVYCNYNTNSSANYQGDIVLESTQATSDGVYFGSAAGVGTLAATRTVSVGGGGFIGGDIYFRNFTQVGATAQTLTNTGTGYIYNYDNNWGGNVTFSSGRMYTRGTEYQGTCSLTKSGATDDVSVGGNLFQNGLTMTNTANGRFGLGNTLPDSVTGNLTLTNSGTYEAYFAYASAGNFVSGDLTATNSGSATAVVLSRTSATDLYIGGNASLTNSSNAATSNCYFGSEGDVTIVGNLILDNSSTGNSGQILFANSTASSITVGGTATVSNAGAGALKRTYLGNNGDVTFGSTLSISNSSSATNSQVYCNYTSNSVAAYNGNIILESTNAATDGIFFGSNGGSATLASGNTISIGGGGFISGDIYFRNFTQTGATAQSLTNTGTGYIYNYSSNWGGNVSFSSGRIYIRQSVFQGTASFTKTGASDDASYGGNTFSGDVVLTNSGSRYLGMANNASDSYGGNLTLNNSGTYNMYVAQSASGNTVAGNLIVNITGSGTNNNVYFANGGSSSLTVTGTTTISNSSSATSTYVYIGERGDVTFNGDVSYNFTGTANTSYLLVGNNSGSAIQINGNLAVDNTAASGSNHRAYIGNSGTVDLNGSLNVSTSTAATNSYIYVAANTSSSVDISGPASFTNAASGTTARMYIGNNGDVTFGDSLSISSSTGAANSQTYINNGGNSTNTYNGVLILEQSSASGDGFYFGSSGGSGTIAAGGNFMLGAGGFVAGDLYIRNITQNGTTASSLNLTGTGRYYPYSSTFGGNMTVNSERYYGRSATYNGDFSLTITGSTASYSYGDNTYNSNATFTMNGSSTLRLADNVGNDFNGDATYVQTSGTMEPARDGTCTYAGNIHVNFASTVTLGAGNGTVELNGGSAQSLNDLGSTSDMRIRRLNINKGGGDFVLNEPFEVQTLLTFTNGVIQTDATNRVIFRDNSSHTGASNSSYVDGPVDKIGNDVFEFPVGDSGAFRPISISAPSSGSAQFRAQYIATDPATLYPTTSLEAGIDHVSYREYWELERIVGSNAVDVTLSWDATSGGVTDLTELIVAHWDSGSSEWTNEGNGGTTGNTTAGTIVTASAVSSFSPFTLGSTTTNNPLPVDLVEFKASPNAEENIVNLFWVTASELNNDYFTVWRSQNIQEFTEIMQVTGQGTTNERTEYNEIDQDPLPGVSYYRLSQTDFDGKTEYFNIEKAVLEMDMADDIKIELYPNPNNGQTMYLKIPNANSDELKLLVNNYLGQDFFADFTVFDTNEHSVIGIELKDKLPQGSYMINIQMKDKVHTHKMIVQ